MADTGTKTQENPAWKPGPLTNPQTCEEPRHKTRQKPRIHTLRIAFFRPLAYKMAS